ncbi:MAG TPA: AAA family ATPase [Sphingomonas sp.]|uniref:AAA family ATPase n=1 Tax=Sphingomonas sp. TaxID=28214 RepID=UPI002CD5E720|nr:AAA family ATPase [Sphingomonas sp.]HMI18829.1 AAA family ATPase [Sphingomonas sp.]
MDEFSIVRSSLLRIGHGVRPSSPLAEALLEWALPHQEWLTGTPPGEAAPVLADLLAAVASAPARDEPRPHVLQLADALGEVLALAPDDLALLVVMIAADRFSRLNTLLRVATGHGFDLPELLGELAGFAPHEAVRLVRRSAALRLGLVGFHANRQGQIELDIRWTLERFLDRAPTVGDDIVDLLVGPRQEARLGLDDFPAAADVDFLVRLLKGALGDGAQGVNILIHGPPGTGKTELARTLAAAVGAPLHAVGEVDEDGDEPTRWERVAALQLAQRILAGRGQTILLFDEMEDLIGEARPSGGDWFAKRDGSKIFVNRLIENNAVPIIWTSNAIGNVDPAILRRMSFVLKLDLPTPAAARRMLDRIATDEGVVPGAAFDTLLAAAPETATVLRVAARAARLAGDADAGARSAGALVRALRDGEVRLDPIEPFDSDLFESDLPLQPLLDSIVDSGVHDVSLLLSGPPGTGKTALAHHLARALDRPLVVKRGSDLLSRWVGGTEAAIADAFYEARQRGGVLLFEEADSLLFDRATAQTSWEVGQVNELLTWLDRHPLPVVAATNYARRLDPATLRRFVFKLELRALGPAKTARAFERFFHMPAPSDLRGLLNLTPGDFALVARQLRHRPAANAQVIVDRLYVESQAKPEGGGTIGFAIAG